MWSAGDEQWEQRRGESKTVVVVVWEVAGERQVVPVVVVVLVAVVAVVRQ